MLRPCAKLAGDKLALAAGQYLVELAEGERQCFHSISSRRVTFRCTSNFAINCAPSCTQAICARATAYRPAVRLATMLGVHRTTVANAYAELESEGLIQGHVGRGTFIKGNGNGLKITPPAPPVLNGNGGIRWELLFADERGEEILSRLTANVPEDALSFVMARPAQEFFPIEELQTCVNAVLRREGAEVLKSWPVGRLSALERSAARDAASRRHRGQRRKFCSSPMDASSPST